MNFIRFINNNSKPIIPDSHDIDTSFIFKSMSKLFTITTNNGSCNFNIEMLKDTSPVIANFIKNDLQNLQYHLNIDDERNILSKFDQLYQGQVVHLDKADLSIAEQIIRNLDIKCIYPFNQFLIQHDLDYDIIIDDQSFIEFLHKDHLKTFTITTNKNEYKCNIFGICSSKVIREYIDKNPTKKEFKYDFDDEFGEFQIICNIFNFETYSITADNMNLLKEICGHLQIENISEKIDRFIHKYDKFHDKIDKQQDVIDTIENLFDLLYHIKEKTVNFVAEFIVQSFWCQTEENVQELAAFILQVVNSDIRLHPYLTDLLKKLDNESNEKNNLKKLIPFIVKKLKFSFKTTFYECAFIYHLLKSEIISRETILCQLQNLKKKIGVSPLLVSDSNIGSLSLSDSDSSEYSYSIQNFDKFFFESNFFQFLTLWFLPEMFAVNCFDQEYIENDEVISFVESFLPDNLDEYKRIRDKGEPTDELTIALRNDDIDTLQSIISSHSNLKNEELIVPFNMFESFVPNGKTNYLNYAAAYGSIKCFKYLLLNYLKCDRSTFSFALFGGNIEIIKIVDNQKLGLNENDLSSESEYDSLSHDDFQFNSESRESKYDKIIPSICNHQNDLFDWIFGSKISSKQLNDKMMNKLLIVSVQTGNVHSFIEILSKRYDISNEMANTLYNIACFKGFYRLSKIIFRTFSKGRQHSFSFNSAASVSFGNLSIFKFSLNLLKTNKKLENAFILAVKRNNKNIIEYFFEKVVGKGFKFSLKSANKALNYSVMSKSSDLFIYLKEKFEGKCHISFNFSLIGDSLLRQSCKFCNFEAFKYIFEEIYPKTKREDFKVSLYFSEAVDSGSIELCQYLIDSKLYIDYNFLLNSLDQYSLINEDIVSLIVHNCNPSLKDQLLHYYFNFSLQHKLYSLVEFLLKQNIYDENALFYAVLNSDIQMVNLILKYKNDPIFINRMYNKDTALNMAVNIGHVKIVKALLKCPSVNPSLCDSNNYTPLMNAMPNHEIINAILDFYGDDFIYQTKQLNFLLKNTLELLMEEEQVAILILDKIIRIKNLNLNDIYHDENFLLFACKSNNFEVFNMLYKLEKIDLNVYYPSSGNTSLIIALLNSSDEIAEILTEDQRTNINAKNFAGETALSIAISRDKSKIVDLLLQNEKFDPKENNIYELLANSSKEYQFKILSSKWFDVNHSMKSYKNLDLLSSSSLSSMTYSSSYSSSFSLSSNSSDKKNNNKYETVLEYAIEINNDEMIDFIIQHPDFDKEKSNIKGTLSKMTEDKPEIFKKLLNLLKEEINDNDYGQETLLLKSIRRCNITFIQAILSHPYFDPKKYNLYDYFFPILRSFSMKSLEVIKVLYEYDKEHEKTIDFKKSLSQGETVFTAILPSKSVQEEAQFDQIIQFFVENGADPNIPNEEGNYPLQHALILFQLNFVHSLIKSNKIDFSKRIKSLNNATFFHLAAIKENSSFLKEFIKYDEKDINSTDDQGETPLMYAARFYRADNIKLLFECNDLDYRRCNNNNKDAVEIITGEDNPFARNQDQRFEAKINDRYLYLQLLLKKIDGMKYNPIRAILDDFNNSKEYKIYAFESFMSSSKEEEEEKEENTKDEVFNSFIDNSSPALSDDDQTSSYNAATSSAENNSDVANVFNKKSSEVEKEVEDKNMESNSSFNDASSSKGLPPLQPKKSEKDETHPVHPPDTKTNSVKEKLPKLIDKDHRKEETQTQENDSEKVCPVKEPDTQNLSQNQPKLPLLDMTSSPRSQQNKVRILQGKAEDGDAVSQYSLGILYSIGKGVQIDKKKAFDYYMMAAEQGHVNAMFSVASCYSYGKGTELNKEKAFEFYLKAAEQGLDKAQFAVAHFLRFGEGGIQKNREKAIEWYQKAAEQGHKASIEALKKL
ncbi:hypothetical protein M9Y10_029552 [Tritrichomonas musculus]|uniref:DUF3447 domain-containing protein n=1 Tax=Tritrichomonas musculus TaxID=1915356 RepID=A0ABR2KNJ2_9EUKA